MANITAVMVKALRDQTAQGMMECKKALQETGGDVEAAKDLLRKRGLVTAQKKSARSTAEGLVGICVNNDGNSAAMVQVQCETDFCARNDVFREMVASVAAMAADSDDGAVEATEQINQAVQDAFARIGENMRYTHGVKISASRVGTYLHHDNKVGVIVGIDGDISDETLADLCMHIAFTDPMGISPRDIPSETVEAEKKFATQQAIESGKPPEIAEKIVAGKMNKFLAANSLLEQPFVRDDKKKVKEILGSVTVTAFARFSVGS